MPDLVPWWNLLPQAQTPEQTANAALLFQRAQAAQRDNSGGNAIAQLFANPGNLQNGMLKPDVLAQGIGSGAVPPKMGMEMMGLAAQMQERQQLMHQRDAQTQAAAVKVRDANRQWLIESVAEPAVAEYENVLQHTGSQQQAQASAQQVYSDGLERAKGDGRLSPQETAGLAPNFDYNRARTNVLGLKGMMERQDKTEAQTLARQREAREETRTEKPEYVGDVIGDDGKVVKAGEPLRYGGPTGFMDVAGNPVKTAPKSVHKMGTKAEMDADAAATPTGPAELHGEEYLKALPSSRASLIKGYAEGRVAFPGSFSLRNPYWAKVVTDISQYDPAFDAVNYNSRSATRKDFTSGKSAANITSFNTAIGHLGSLLNAGEKLGNTWSPAYNTVANFLATQTGDPRVKEFNVARDAVAAELTRAFRGTGGSLTEVEHWRENLNAANSPEQLRATIRQGVDLLASRINAVGEQYRRGMGTTADVTELLTPAAKKVLQRLPGGEEILSDHSTTIGPAAARGAAGEKPTAEAPIPPAPGQAAQKAPETASAAPPIELVPKAQRQDGKVVVLKDENGVQHRFVVTGGGASLVPAGDR